MKLKQLKLFRDIAREQSFARAAQLNHMTQPAVSVHIKKLEQELGRELFKRSPHHIQLTHEGRDILDQVKEILRLCDNIKIRSSMSRGMLEGDIRIATIHSIGMYEMGDFLSSFMKQYPRVCIHLEYQRYDDIYRLLLKEKIDLGIVAYPERRTKIEAIPYSADEMVLVAAADHPLARRKSTTLAQIAGEAFIAFEAGMPTREATDKMLQAAGVEVDIRMTNDNIYTLKKAVQAGVGVAIVPSSAVEEEVQRESLVSLRIRHCDTRRPLAVLKRRSSRLAEPAQVFVEHLLHHGQAAGSSR